MPNPLQSDFWQTRTPAVPVGKRRAYIIVPAFSITDISTPGISIVARQYNFVASHNFTLTSLPAKPTGQNCTLCIKYRVGHTVYRYRLWTNDGANIPNVALYAGQVIKKNFTIEVWSDVNNTTADLDNDLQLNLSILVKRLTLDEADTTQDSTATEVDDLQNTNAIQPSVTSPSPTSGGEPQNTVVDSTSAAYTDVVCLDGILSWAPGLVVIKWVNGVYEFGGLWFLGMYDLVDNLSLEVITTFGQAVDAGFDTEAEAKAAAAGYRKTFNLLVGVEQFAIRNHNHSGANTNGTPSPTFLVQSALALPLTYSESQVVPDNTP